MSNNKMNMIEINGVFVCEGKLQIADQCLTNKENKAIRDAINTICYSDYSVEVKQTMVDRTFEGLDRLLAIRDADPQLEDSIKQSATKITSKESLRQYYGEITPTDHVMIHNVKFHNGECDISVAAKDRNRHMRDHMLIDNPQGFNYTNVASKGGVLEVRGLTMHTTRTTDGMFKLAIDYYARGTMDIITVTYEDTDVADYVCKNGIFVYYNYANTKVYICRDKSERTKRTEDYIDMVNPKAPDSERVMTEEIRKDAFEYKFWAATASNVRGTTCVLRNVSHSDKREEMYNANGGLCFKTMKEEYNKTHQEVLDIYNQNGFSGLGDALKQETKGYIRLSQMESGSTNIGALQGWLKINTELVTFGDNVENEELELEKKCDKKTVDGAGWILRDALKAMVEKFLACRGIFLTISLNALIGLLLQHKTEFQKAQVIVAEKEHMMMLYRAALEDPEYKKYIELGGKCKDDPTYCPEMIIDKNADKFKFIRTVEEMVFELCHIGVPTLGSTSQQMLSKVEEAIRLSDGNAERYHEIMSKMEDKDITLTKLDFRNKQGDIRMKDLTTGYIQDTLLKIKPSLFETDPAIKLNVLESAGNEYERKINKNRIPLYDEICEYSWNLYLVPEHWEAFFRNVRILNFGEVYSPMVEKMYIQGLKDLDNRLEELEELISLCEDAEEEEDLIYQQEVVQKHKETLESMSYTVKVNGKVYRRFRGFSVKYPSTENCETFVMDFLSLEEVIDRILATLECERKLVEKRKLVNGSLKVKKQYETRPIGQKNIVHNRQLCDVMIKFYETLDTAGVVYPPSDTFMKIQAGFDFDHDGATFVFKTEFVQALMKIKQIIGTWIK